MKNNKKYLAIMALVVLSAFFFSCKNSLKKAETGNNKTTPQTATSGDQVPKTEDKQAEEARKAGQARKVAEALKAREAENQALLKEIQAADCTTDSGAYAFSDFYTLYSQGNTPGIEKKINVCLSKKWCRLYKRT